MTFTQVTGSHVPSGSSFFFSINLLLFLLFSIISHLMRKKILFKCAENQYEWNLQASNKGIDRSLRIKQATLPTTLSLTLHCTQLTAHLLVVLYSYKWGCQVRVFFFGHPPLTGDRPHLLECGTIVKLLLRAYGCLNYCSPTFLRLFNLTVPLLAQDKMENPCSAGLSELSTHSQ